MEQLVSLMPLSATNDFAGKAAPASIWSDLRVFFRKHMALSAVCSDFGVAGVQIAVANRVPIPSEYYTKVAA